MTALEPVSAALEADLREHARKHGVLVWLDKEGAYTTFADRLRGCPEPHGVTVAALVASIAAASRRFRLSGAGITEFTPWSPAAAASDLATIQRILGALAAWS